MKRRHRLKPIGSAVALTVVTLVLLANPASGHAALEDSNPSDGQTLTELPQQVSITLNEPAIKPSYIAVLAPDGSRANDEDAKVADKTVTSQITSTAQAGTYTMSYRVISTDGHVVTGSLKFKVEPTDASSETTLPPADTSASASSDDGVTVTPADGSGSSDSSAAVVILIFFVVALVGLALMIRAGLRNSGAEDV